MDWKDGFGEPSFVLDFSISVSKAAGKEQEAIKEIYKNFYKGNN